MSDAIQTEQTAIELNDQQLDEVTAGVKDITITKHVDKASSSLLSSDGGCPGFEYWFQQLMF